MSIMNEQSGILLFDKSEGRISLKEELTLKKKLDLKKCGHLGTLDPFASGLLIIGVNKGTRVLGMFEEWRKTYIATIKLGELTDTGDLTGNIVKTKEVSPHKKEEIENVLNSFLGKSKQIPPMYSALKRDGVPLYKLARDGIEVERKQREIDIKDIYLNEYDSINNTITFTADVSKGTYIRTLGEDISTKLDELGHLIKLRRIKVGEFSIEQSKDFENISLEDLIPIHELFKEIPLIEITNPSIEKRVRNGSEIYFKSKHEKVFFTKDGEDLAIYARLDEQKYKSVKQFA